MDFTSFCREIYSLMLPRLPLQGQTVLSLTALARQGGWYYPSARDKHAFFFDCHSAYRAYLNGAEPVRIADAMESSFLESRWEAEGRVAETLSRANLTPEWGLRLSPLKESAYLPADAFYLCWGPYILEPCCRFDRSPSFRYHSLSPGELLPPLREERNFWPFFWRELIRQDPPRLFAPMPLMPPREIDLSRPEYPPDPTPKESSYILTSRKTRYGAAVLFYPGLLARIHRMLSDYYLLIASPHEAALFPGDGPFLKDALHSSLRERSRLSQTENTFPPALCQYTVDRGLHLC